MFDKKIKDEGYVSPFKVGDVVSAKSQEGWPKMNVVVSHSGQTHTVWFLTNGQNVTACWPDECLYKI